MDFMFRAESKEAWDVFAAQFRDDQVRIDEIGPIVIAPAVIGNDGQIVTPAIINEAHHVNVRLIRPTLSCATLALGSPGVEWINPATVNSPERVWAGGSMNYWRSTQENT